MDLSLRDRARTELFSYPGYVRVRNLARIRDRDYRKGWELRLIVPLAEFDHVRDLIEQAELRLAKAFMKKQQLIQPVYGKEAVTEYLAAKASAASGQVYEIADVQAVVDDLKESSK